MKDFGKAFSRAKQIANKVRSQGFRKFTSLAARNESQGDVGNLYVYKFIGSSWWEEGVSAEAVRDALASMKGVKKLNIYINSEGGDVFDGKAIYTQLKRFDAEKTVYIDGIAASAASFIAMAGDKVIISPIGTMMIHDAWSFAMGNAGDMRATADLLDMLSDDIAKTYAAKTGRTAEDFRSLMLAETWLNAEESVKEGLADSIGVTTDDEEADTSTAEDRVAKSFNTTHGRIEEYQNSLMKFRLERAGRAKSEVESQQVRASPGKRAR